MSLRKSLAEKLYQQDRRNYISLSQQQINKLVNDAFDKWGAAPDGQAQVLARIFAADLLESAAQVTVEACAELLPDLKDKQTRNITLQVLARACESGEFSTAITVSQDIQHLLVAIRNRMMDRIGFIISEARADAQISPKLLEGGKEE